MMWCICCATLWNREHKGSTVLCCLNLQPQCEHDMLVTVCQQHLNLMLTMCKLLLLVLPVPSMVTCK